MKESVFIVAAGQPFVHCGDAAFAVQQQCCGQRVQTAV
jgi:hypothetical protein